MSLTTLRLVGRGVELRQLEAALRAHAQGATDAPALLTLSGEAGVGKSRLVAEVTAKLRDTPLRWISTRCLPHGPTQPWHPLRELVASLAGVDQDLPLPERVRRLDAMAEREGLSPAARDAARHLLSLPTDDPAWPDLPPAKRRSRLFANLQTLVARLGHERPAVLIFEDFHWTDPVTLEWLDALLASSQRPTGVAASPTPFPGRGEKGSPPAAPPPCHHTATAFRGRGVAVLVIHRSEFRHLWPAGVRRADFALQPLSPADSELLLSEIFELSTPSPSPPPFSPRESGEGESPHPPGPSAAEGATGGVEQATRGWGALCPTLRAELIRRTGGNPFFIEEAVRLLLDRGDVVRGADGALRWARPDTEITLPESPRGLVEERVARLERRLRHLLQCAAVIGPDVRPALLAHLAEVESQLDLPLKTLIEEHMLERRDEVQGLVLLFRHAITHEVTYATLLRRQRAHLHGRLGLHLEERHRDHLEEAAELLAHHFGRSDQPAKAIRYLRLAAEQAQRLCAHDAAEEHLARLDDLLRTHEDTLSPRDLVDTRAWIALERARLARLRGHLDRATELLAQGLDALSSPPLPVPPPREKGLGNGGDPREKRTEPEKDLPIAGQGNGGNALLVRLLRTWGETERQRGHLPRAVELHTQALRACEADPTPDAQRERMLTLMGLAIAQRAEGRPQEALALLDEAEQTARRLGDLASLANVLNNRGICLLNCGQAAQALTPLEQAIALHRELGDRRNLVAALNNLGIVLERLLELDRALTAHGEALRIAYEIGHHRATLANHINVGQLLQWLDNQPEAMRHFRCVIDLCREQPDDVALALALVNLGWSHLHGGDVEAAAALVDYAEQVARPTGDHSAIVHALLVRARLATLRGDGEAGRAAAQEAVERLAQSHGDELATALRLRADAERVLGDHAASHASLTEATAAARRTADRREQVLIAIAEALLAREENRTSAHRRAVRRARRILNRFLVPLLGRTLQEVESP